jgi:hypothetical protein
MIFVNRLALPALDHETVAPVQVGQYRRDLRFIGQLL